MKRREFLKRLLLSVVLVCIVVGVTACSSKPEKLDINNELVQNMYKTVNPSNDANVLVKLYEKPGEFNNEYILTTAIKMYVDSQKGGKVETIPQKDVEENIYKIFGRDITFKHDDVYVFFDSYCMFRYDRDKKLYILDGGCGGNTNEYFYRKIIDAEETDKELVIYEKVIYVYYEWGDVPVNYGQVSIYNNFSDKKLIKYYEQNPSEDLKITIDDYINDASTYKYIFEKIDNNYIFKSIQLVK